MTALALAPPPLPTATADREAAENFNQICAQLQGAPTQTMTHSEWETLLEGRELLRRLLPAHLDERRARPARRWWLRRGRDTRTNGCRSARGPVCLARSR